jgi:EmrB/QacA subfamily drug resistance transporter
MTIATRRTRGWTLALTSIGFFMVALDTLVVVTALPAIQRDLGASFAMLQWTMNAFTLAYGAGIITASALGDALGRRRVFAAGLALFSISSAACALAPSIGALITARTVQGLAAAMVTPLSLTILAAAFPPERRGTVVGIWGGIGGLAVAGGPLVGGLITQGLDWHWVFWINVPIGVLAVLLVRARLPESRGPGARFDLAGVVSSSFGAVALLFGLSRLGERGGSDAIGVVAFGCGVVAIAAFIAWQRRAAVPLVPLHLFRNRTFAAANATSFLMIGTLSAAAFLITQYLQLAAGHSAVGAGLRLLPWTAAPLVIAPLAGRVSDRIGRRSVLAAGTFLQAVGLGWFAARAGSETSYAELVPALVLAGIGIAMALPVAPTAALGAVAPADIGKASGINSSLQRFGGAFAVAIAAAVFSSHNTIGGAAGFVLGFRPALAVAAALSALATVTALAIARPISCRRAPTVNPPSARTSGYRAASATE